LAFELDQADQKFSNANGLLVEARDRSNSWAGSGRLKAFSFQILAKLTAYILSNMGFFA
jgi:hypothetical protein